MGTNFMLDSHTPSPPSQAVQKYAPPSCTSLPQTGASPGAHVRKPGFGEKSPAAIAQILARVSEFASGYTWRMDESLLNLGFGDKFHA